MATKELSVYEKVEKCLYMEKTEAERYLTPGQMEIKKRLMLCVSVMLDDPLTPDTEIVNFLMAGCGGSCDPISQTQAYRDVAALKKMVGSIQLSSKAWYRHMIIEGAKEGIRIAKLKEDAKGIAVNIDKIGKYTRADKEDDTFDWTQMLPPVLEPTDDVSVLEGFEPVENLEEERKAFRSLFKKEMQSKAIDIQLE